MREHAGLIDRSDTGKLAIVGKDRYSWLQGMVSNDVRLLEQGDPGLQACILNATGHVLTDLMLVNVVGNESLADALGLNSPDFVLLDLPRNNRETIATLLDRYLILEEAEIVDVTDLLACLSLQGPSASNFLSQLAPATHAFRIDADHTGSGGADLYIPILDREKWMAIMRSEEIAEIDSETQELLRIEAAIPKYGVDMDESVIALEANLGPTHISLNKGCYLGQEIIARIDSRGHTNRALTGLVFSPNDVPVPGEKVYAPPPAEETEEREMGRITSTAAASPAMEGRPIALAYVRHEHRSPGTRLRIGEGRIATLVELPFYPKKPQQD